MLHRIREAFDMGDDQLSGTVEVVETYMGGLEKNKHNDKKLKAGRGAVGKTAVIGARTERQRKSRQKLLTTRSEQRFTALSMKMLRPVQLSIQTISKVTRHLTDTNMELCATVLANT